MDRAVRIDSYLWAVRIFKTRSIAQDACKKGRVAINNITAKPAKMVSPGDTISVRKPPVTFSFRVIRTASNRMGAKLVPEYIENVTPADQYELLEMKKMSGYIDRAHGLGRPTKRERRDLDQFFERAPVEDLTFDDELSDVIYEDDDPELMDDALSDEPLDWDNW